MLAKFLKSRVLVPGMDFYRFRAATGAMASRLEEMEYWEPERLRSWQVQQLRPFLRHCDDNIEFYRRRFREVGFRPQEFEDLSQLEVVPALTKRDIQKHSKEMFSRFASPSSLKSGRTGGSTGQPTAFYQSYQEAAWMRATTLRFRAWAGIQPGDRIVRMGGLRYTRNWRDPLVRFYFRRVENVYNLPCPAVDDETIDAYIHIIQQVQPRVLWGYPSAIFLIASRLIETRKRLPSVERIWVSSEVLTEQQRSTLETAFDTTPFDMYGGGDTHVAGECEAHAGKHMVQHSRLIEVVADDQRSAHPGTEGRVLVTSFFNYAWPYVRYEMGDIAELLPEQECACGRTLPKIGRILGRTGDYVLTPEGARATVPNFTLVFAPLYEQVRLYQIVQHKLDEVEVRIVPGAAYGAGTDAFIVSGLRRFLGASMRIRISATSDVEQTMVGKRRIVISHVQQAA